MKSNCRQYLVVSVLLFLSIAYLYPMLGGAVSLYDEGIVLVGADRVLHGQVPHKDFWSMYPIGQYYTLALLFKFFGASVLVERVYDLIVRAILSVLVFLIIKKLGLPRIFSAIGWGMALVVLEGSKTPSYPIYPSILLVFISTYFFLNYLDVHKLRDLFLCGLLMALAALFRHDLAGMSACCILVTLFIERVVCKSGFVRPVFYFLSGVMVVGLPAIVYVMVDGSAPDVIRQLLLAPADVMPSYRWLPYPTKFSISSVPFYIYPFVLLCGLVSSFVVVIRGGARQRSALGFFLFSFIGVLFINQVRVRSDYTHLVPVVLLCAVVGPAVICKALGYCRTRSFKVWVYVFSFLVLIPLAKPLVKYFKHLGDIGSLSYVNERGGAHIDSDLQDLLSFVGRNTSRDELIYVGVDNHDKFVVNDVAVYFLADRMCATKYHELHPGVANLESVQREIVRDLERSSVKLVVLTSGYWYEPNETRVDSGVDYLDSYIRKNYSMVRKLGRYEVWMLN